MSIMGDQSSYIGAESLKLNSRFIINIMIKDVSCNPEIDKKSHKIIKTIRNKTCADNTTSVRLIFTSNFQRL